MSTVVRDDRNPEDVKKVDGDDAYDMLRYGLTNMKQPQHNQEKQAQHPLKGVSSIW